VRETTLATVPLLSLGSSWWIRGATNRPPKVVDLRQIEWRPAMGDVEKVVARGEPVSACPCSGIRHVRENIDQEE
jgi:hypothetical protein